MSVVKALGLEDGQVMDLLIGRWPQWREQVPTLGLLGEPASIDVWRREASSHEVDLVLLGLAELAAQDGRDDRDAANVLAWLLLPAAIRLSAELAEVDPDIDEHIAACLWIQVRTFAWRTSSRVAASIAWRLRRQVLMELGDRRRLDGHGARTLARTVVDDELARAGFVEVDPQDSLIRDELLAVLEWARQQELISATDSELLVDVVAAAGSWRAGYPDSIPLLGEEVSERVAARWGVSGRTVRRRAGRSIAVLAAAVQGEGRSNTLRRIA